MRSLQGEFSTMIRALTGAVIDLRTHVEAAIDFPEEEIDFLADPALAERLANVRRHFAAVTRSAGQGRLLRDGMTVVLAGAPNAGKSSLLNRLAGYEAAIVTAVPGTTRDVLRERIMWTVCRCISSIRRDCGSRRIRSKPKACDVRRPKWRAPTGCCL